MDATQAHLRRKAAFVDRVQMHGDIPLPSWIELSVTDLCNRTCAFCPRADVYPNQPLHMGLGLAEKMAADLRALDYGGTVAFSGFGEPLLHPQVVDLVLAFNAFHVEVVTNGDRLTPAMVRDLEAAGCGRIVVSMYDGPEQVAGFEAMFAGTGIAHVLRDRWQPEEKNFGLSLLTNRAGTIHAGTQAPVVTTRPCAYPAYHMLVDWNGDVLLCPHDWHKRIRFGNLAAQGLMEVWASPALRKRRMHLLRGRDGLSPCAGCNAGGMELGKAHGEAWRG